MRVNSLVYIRIVNELKDIRSRPSFQFPCLPKFRNHDFVHHRSAKQQVCPRVARGNPCSPVHIQMLVSPNIKA